MIKHDKNKTESQKNLYQRWQIQFNSKAITIYESYLFNYAVVRPINDE